MVGGSGTTIDAAHGGVPEDLDVLVCGAGMAGLTAALSAAEAGSRVAVVEKAPYTGGSARLSGGLIWTFKSVEEAWRRVPLGDAGLQDLVVGGLSDGLAWLRTLGVETSAWGEFITGAGVSVDPNQLIAALEYKLDHLGVPVVMDCALERLRPVDGGRWQVVLALADGSTRTEVSRSVILATGGFQGSPDLIRRYCVPSASNVVLRANPWSTGDGFAAATEVGASASMGLEWFYGHALVGAPATMRPMDFRNASQYFGAHGVALNLRGQRFADETAGTGEEVLNSELAQQPEGRGMYIADNRVMHSTINGRSVAAVIDFARDRGGVVLVADDLEQLASEMRSYGVHCGRPEDWLQDPAMGGWERVSQPPFFAVKVQAAITFTGGGLAVDSHMQVLRRATGSSMLERPLDDMAKELRQVPIAGLWAVGTEVGNVHNRGYCGGLATALATGRTAGQAAARRPMDG